MSQNHESDDQLELYALDRLGDSEISRVEEHLLVCEDCRERLEQNAAFAFAMRDVLKLEPELSKESAFKSWFGALAWKPHFAMAAFAAIILIAGIFWIGGRAGSGTRGLVPVASLQLVAMRGEIQTVPAAREMDLILADAPATGAPFRVEIVGANGSPEWSGTPKAGGSGLQVRITKSFLAGTYFARLYDTSGKLLHEYGFRVIG